MFYHIDGPVPNALAVDNEEGMAEPAVSRAKAASRDIEKSGRILLVETSPPAQPPRNQRLSSAYAVFDLSPDLQQAFQIARAGLHELIIAGPPIEPSRLEGVGAALSGPPVKLQSLLSKLSPVYQAQDARQLLRRLVEAGASATGSQQVFTLLCDRVTAEPDLSSLCKQEACLPHLGRTLGRYLEPLGNPDPGADVDSWLWMVPLCHESRLEAVLGFVSWDPADERARRSWGMLRLLSLVSAPFLAALRDMERISRRADELEAVLQIKSHLMSNTCHEFRSLLAVVRGYCKRILDGRTGAITDVQRDQLTVVLRNTNKLLDLVSHTLPFVAEQQLRVDSFDLREIWQSALQRAQRHLSEKSIRIREEIPPANFTVAADKGRLAVVFELVLAGAIQCAAPGGEIKAQFLRGANGEVTVRLLAAGAGLPAHVLDGLFDHGGESIPSASPPDGQRISGLSFVHDMIWLHGGRIAVMSSEEEGTVFVFTFPPPPQLRQDVHNAGISGG